jgi:uncharacterized protein YggT (Ycf19 family)
VELLESEFIYIIINRIRSGFVADMEKREPENRSDTSRSRNTGNNRNTTIPPGDRWFYIVRRIIYFILSIIIVLLLLRFLFMLLAADPGAGFVNFLYQITEPLVSPFLGIFAQPEVGEGVLETGTLIAMLVYSLIAWGIVALLGLFRTGRRKV